MRICVLGNVRIENRRENGHKEYQRLSYSKARMKLMAHLFEGRYNIDGYNVCTKHMIGAHGECVSAE